ncbi:MAG: RluA family pseudouridine synthase [Anaerolineales bacterium]
MTAGTTHTFELKAKGRRLDKALAEQLPELSRSQIQRLIESGQVTLDGRVPTKAGMKTAGGEIVEVHVPPSAPARAQPEDIPLQIVYEDGNVIVVDKPAGMVVHPAAGHAAGTLVNAVLAHAPEMEGVGGEQRPGIVHRLDKDTSGLIIVAKNDRALRSLQRQFKDRRVEKHYTALVVGAPPTPTGRVQAAIGRDPANRRRMKVFAEAGRTAREAISEYNTTQAFRGFTLIDVRPITGRTHQVRVHMAFLDCPLAGDRLYANQRSAGVKLPGLRRHFLHASRLMLQLPDGIEKTFASALPDDLSHALDALRTR